MDSVSEASPLVLVVDDEISTSVMLQYIFEREGFRVERLTEGVQAFETARTLLPDLILLDIMLPRISGFDILRQLKSDATTMHIPTILITASAREPADVVQGLNLGADDYLYKPFAPQELMARVQSKMRARVLEESLRRRTRELEMLLAVSEQLSQLPERIAIVEHASQMMIDAFGLDTIIIGLIPSEKNTDKARFHIRRANAKAHLLDDRQIQMRMQRLSKRDTAFTWDQGDKTAPFPEMFGAFAMIHLNHQPLGTLVALRTNAGFMSDDVRLLEGIARQVALAVRNADLYQLQNAHAQHLEAMVKAKTDELVSAHRMLVRNEKLAAIGHLAASIAHEINNPLMPATLLLDQLEESLRMMQIEVDLQDLFVVRDNLLRIQRIVKSLLDFSRQDIELRSLDLARILNAVTKLSHHGFEMEGKLLSLSVEPGTMVYGSRDQLEAVFINLILNARAAMHENSRLTITAYKEEQEVIIRFEDTGSGIPKEYLDRIFDPFFSTKSDGTGLGLFVCFSVIQGHHGKISVESTPGQGTVFTIRLPAHED
jgi:signal transduction histidine kinase